MKFDLVTGNGVQMLPLKYDPLWPQGGTIINRKIFENKSDDLKRAARVQLTVLYKKRLFDQKGQRDGSVQSE